MVEVPQVAVVVDVSRRVSDHRLFRREAPVIVDDELEGISLALQFDDGHKVVATSVHGDVPLPTREGACQVNIVTTVLPGENVRHHV